MRLIGLILLTQFAITMHAVSQDAGKRSHQGLFLHCVGSKQVFNSDLADSKFKPGIAIGMYQHFDLGAKIQIRLGGAIAYYSIDEVDYSPVFGTDIDPSTGIDYFKSYVHNEVQIIQVNIPVNIRYKLFGDTNHGYIAGGFEGRIVVSDEFTARIQESGYGYLDLDNEPFYTSRNPTFACHLEFGYEFAMGEHKMHICALGKYGLTTQFKAENNSPITANISKGHPLDIGIGVGFIF